MRPHHWTVQALLTGYDGSSESSHVSMEDTGSGDASAVMKSVALLKMMAVQVQAPHFTDDDIHTEEGCWLFEERNLVGVMTNI